MSRLLIVFVAIFWHFAYADDLIIEVADGKVQGTTVRGDSGKEFYAWRGIPFAKPPVGSLRFKAPVKPDKWTGVLDGRSDKKACIQGIGAAFSEDCLYINVYTPVKPRSNLSLPVMYWIYGGGYTSGSSRFTEFGPTAILEEDVIYVSANYRLGVFGFLSLEDAALPGNAALKDQLAGILWTKANIARFGGNPNDITIFGESAGAMSVGYHVVSPLSRNLYKAAILESGTGLVNFISTNARNNAVQLAKSLDSSINAASSSQKILNVLQAADVARISNLARQTYRPVLEVENGNPTPFLSKPIFEAIESGNYTQVPIIIGTNSEESLGFIGNINSAKSQASAMDNNHLGLLPVMNLKNGATKEQVALEIYKEYVGNSKFGADVGLYLEWMSQNLFVRSAIKHALLQSKYKPAYFYKFSYSGTPSSRQPRVPNCGTVGHGDELAYLFDTSFNVPIATQADKLTRKRFVKLWTNFAKFKNPTPSDSSAELLQHVKWEPMDANNLQYLDIDTNLKMKTKLLADKVAFWDHLWEKYATRPYNTF